jgi:hypothetical protein
MMNRGCNIRVVYAMMGTAIWKYLKSSSNGRPVPMAHVVQDWNMDGIYDRYLHMKVMAVSGVYGTNRTANFVWNGSSNWTTKSLRSDEELMRVSGPGYRRAYARWIDHLFLNPPPRPELSSSTYADSGTGVERSYAYDGSQVAPRTTTTTPTPTPTVNPYAHMELD